MVDYTGMDSSLNFCLSCKLFRILRGCALAMCMGTLSLYLLLVDDVVATIVGNCVGGIAKVAGTFSAMIALRLVTDAAAPFASLIVWVGIRAYLTNEYVLRLSWHTI